MKNTLIYVIRASIILAIVIATPVVLYYYSLWFQYWSQ